MITVDTPLLSAPRCTEEQAIRYVLSRPHGEYTDFDIGSIISAYFHVAGQAGIDPCLALAQSIHETANFSSWWAGRPRRNPAGIGVNGETRKDVPADRQNWAWDGAVWRAGLSFPTWAVDAIPAHIGRLLAYATMPAARTQIQAALVERALALRPLPAHYHGAAPTLAGLNRRWAVGRGYAAAIAKIANGVLK